MGYAIVIFESLLSSVGFKRALETPILEKLAGIIPKLLGVYLIIRFADLILRGKLGLIFSFDFKSLMFIVENVLYVVPLVILMSASNRRSAQKLFIAAVSLLLAGSVYRFNAYIIGFDPGQGWQYFPSFSELMITVGVISFEILAYLIFVKKLPVLPDVKHA
jgi:Ni/Fe-hydrogenase subunit HybB-like protein